MKKNKFLAGGLQLSAITIPLVAAFIWLSAHSNLLTEPPIHNSVHPVETSAATLKDISSSNDLERAFAFIKRSEYFIGPVVEKETYHSTNRRNNLRFTYDTDGFTIEPRTGSVDSWKHRLSLSAISKGNIELTPSNAPTFCNAENRLEIEHDGFLIEYANTEEGMRQNFIVTKDLSGEDGMLVARLHGEGILSPVLHDSTSVVFCESGARKVWYRDLKVWDADGDTLQAGMRVEGDDIALVVDDVGASYPIVIDPLSTTADWTSSGTTGEKYGFSVSTAGDVNADGYSDIIIGAPYFDNGQVDEGAAFVFLGSASGLEAAYDFMAEGEWPNARFGWSVSTAGDVNKDGVSDIVVGMQGYSHSVRVGPNDNQNLTVGRVLVWQGYRSTTPGVGNNGGIRARDVIPGIYSTKGYGADAGPNRLNAHWYVDGYHTMPNSTSDIYEGNLGYSVSCAGDVNGDGISEVIAGAPGYDVPFKLGEAYVWHGASAFPSMGDYGGLPGVAEPGVTGQFRIKGSISVAPGTIGAPNWKASGPIVPFGKHRLGHSVSGAGDFNGDGFSDVIIGAPECDDLGVASVNVGATFIWYGSAVGLNNGVNGNMFSSWQWRQFGEHASSKFGYSVSAAGDANGDRFTDVVVGSPYYGLSLQPSWVRGKAYIWNGSALPQSTIPPDDYVVGDGQPGESSTMTFLGWSVSEAGDVNADGYGDILIGDPGDTEHGQNAGKALVLLGRSSPNLYLYAWEVYGTAYWGEFGYSVSCAGDVNGDGFSDVLVGSPMADKVALYHGGAETLSSTENTVLNTDDPSVGNVGTFGYSVSTAGDVNGDGYSDIIIGDPTYSVSAANGEGSVFVFFGSSVGVQTPTNTSDPLYPWHASSLQGQSRFGHSVSSAGDVNSDGYSDIVVGAPHYEDQSSDDGEGWVFVWYGSSTGMGPTGTPANADWSAQSDQTYTSGNDALTEFGYSVSSTGDFNKDGYSDVVVGAPGYNFTNHVDEGSAFMWFGGSAGLNGGVDGTPADAAQSDRVHVSDAGVGHSVACAGDFNGDGYSDVVIGAPNKLFVHPDDPNLNVGNAGAAFIYLGWGQQSFNINHELCGPGRIGISNENSGYSLNARVGTSVSTAGDVDGDGRDDIIVGAPGWREDGVNARGAAFIYKSASLSLHQPAWQIAHDLTDVNDLGAIVASVGDIDGDGYCDIAYRADRVNGQTEEQHIYIHLGSPSGPTNVGHITDGWDWSSDYPIDFIVDAVSSIGDINADGFTDVAIANSDNVNIYYGNGTLGIEKKVRQFRGDDGTTPVQTGNLSKFFNSADDITLGILSMWHAGQAETKLVWEIRKSGFPFSSTAAGGITNSVAQSGDEGTWHDPVVSGAANTHMLPDLTLGDFYRWRARLKTHPSTMLDGQVYSRWFYPGIGDKLNRNFLVETGFEKPVVGPDRGEEESNLPISTTLTSNLVRDNIEMTIAVSGTEPVSIMCVDAAGKMVGIAADNLALSEGSHTISLPVAHLSTGVYFIVVKSGNSLSRHKVIVAGR